MFFRLMVMMGLLAGVTSAQIGYQGPSIMSRGATGVGDRAGQQVDLRFFASVNGVYDTGLVPVASDSQGNVVDPGGLAGVEGAIGAYGSHSWRKALLGLDYEGNYRHYTTNSFYDGSDQQLLLGYTYQKSRKLIFDFRETAATYSRAIGGVLAPAGTDLGFGPTTNADLLFDNRTSLLETGMDVTWVKSARNSFSVGGEGYGVFRHSSSLIDMHGYTLHGAFEHRVSRERSVGLTYTHYHYDYPNAYGQADIDALQAGFAGTFDRRRWTFKVSAGALQAQVQALQTVVLDPIVAGILGVATTVETYYSKTVTPNIEASLTRRFKSASLNFSYLRGVNPGNGVYLTSRQENAGVSYAYTGVRKVSINVSGSYSSYSSLGQTLTPYRYVAGGVSVSYALSKSFHLVGRYDSRHQDVVDQIFRKDSYRTTLGIAFSPGDIPLSLW